MTRRRELCTGIGAAVGMLLLILDAKTAFQGASEGIQLCISSVIPSLFPFFILSIFLTGILAGRSFAILRPLGKLCGLPVGGEALMLIGLIGGYPAGAQSIAQAYRSGSLSKEDAHRMLGFCSNAGPAFIFGILGQQFSPHPASWLLWLIHMISAAVTGALLPGRSHRRLRCQDGQPVTLYTALERSLKTMASVCGWVILFRVILAFLGRWFLWLLPQTGQTVAAGLLELTNGCLRLRNVKNEGLRFILASGFLACGGLCVTMQTVSVTGSLGLGRYLPGKLVQTLVSILLAALTQRLLFPAEMRYPPQVLWLLPVGLIAGILIFLRKTSSNPAAVGV